MERISYKSKSIYKKLCMVTIRKKIKEIDGKVESWLSGHGIPLSRKQKIMEEIQRELVKNSDFDVEREVLSILPHEEIKSCSPLSRLRKVPLLKDMDEGVLVEISGKLHPEKYTRGQIIIEKDKTLERCFSRGRTCSDCKGNSFYVGIRRRRFLWRGTSSFTT
ncbi:unnamed protein product [Prunus armeniaca]|uniref:Uncharacterized protein n=1 Tax=Prunus armeniaca TaxID=36596 RepID=A0A6J5WKZ8_PRUAR|nr:unnamed protein product [Prunus armeniaca]